MADAFIGEIRAFAFTYPPEDWAACNGQAIPVEQNPALLSIIGNTYGGNGPTSFNLPNLQANALAGTGQGPGLNQVYQLGKEVGADEVTLGVQQMPSHTHQMNGETTAVSSLLTNAPSSTAQLSRLVYQAPGNPPPTAIGYKAFASAAAATAPVTMNSLTIGTAGGANGITQPHDNRQPYLMLNFCICLTNGEYPIRP